MKAILIWVVLLMVVGIPAYACCRAAGEADRWVEEHAKNMLPKRSMEEKP